MSRLRNGPMYSSVVDPDAIQKATITPGVVGIEICPACGRCNLEVNRRFGASGCFLGHPIVDYIAYVAIPAEAVVDEIPDAWKSRGGLVPQPSMRGGGDS